MWLKNILPGFVLFCSLHSSAQKIIINGEETSRLLKWSDFSGNPDTGVDYFAFTYWNISYKYDAFQFKGDTIKWQVQIILDLGKNSWKKKDKISDTVLKHEQGHFDVGIICAMELQERITNTIFLKGDYQVRLSAVVKEVVDKYKKMDLQYDVETNHSVKREEQWKWDAFFAIKTKRSQ